MISDLHATFGRRLHTSVAAAAEFSMQLFHKAYGPKGKRVMVTRCGKLPSPLPTETQVLGDLSKPAVEEELLSFESIRLTGYTYLR
jgi:hypothetical protein